jgi:5-methylcytosine-specific restriction endonuclease McrA
MTAAPKPPMTIRQRKRLQSKPHVIDWRIRQEVITLAEGTCAWCGVHGGRLDCHHRLPRSRGGKDSVLCLVAVHRLCHSHIHENPAEAMARGFTVRSADELLWPVQPAQGTAT